MAENKYNKKPKKPQKKCTVTFKVEKILCPSNAKVINIGDYMIIGCSVIKHLDGDPIEYSYERGKVKNFSIKGNSGVMIAPQCEYTAVLSLVPENKFKGTYYMGAIIDKVELQGADNERKFLEAILTPKRVKELYEVFENPIDLIRDGNVTELKKCKGIGENSVKTLIRTYHENFCYAEIIGALSEYELTTTMMKRLLANYGTSKNVIKAIKDNVYTLANQVDGIGFKKCDALALKVGLEENSPFRLESFLLGYFEEQAQNGDSWLAPDVIISACKKTFGTVFTDSDIYQSWYSLGEQKLLGWSEDKQRIYLQQYYDLEKEISERLIALGDKSNDCVKRDLELETKIIKQVEQDQGFPYSEEQKKVMFEMLDEKISLLVAGGGSGKSTMIKGFKTIFNKYNLATALVSFSAKAAARILEATGFEGMTLHRLLKALGGDVFDFNETNTLFESLVIIDEASFLSADLFLALLKALPLHARIILVGDEGQLPSITTGNVFYDLIQSKQYYTGRLNTIHRQAEGSAIIEVSRKVRNKQPIFPYGWTGKKVLGDKQDLLLDVYDEPRFGIPKLLENYKHFVKTLDDVKNTQIILSKRNSGEVCTHEINYLIQSELNPFSVDKPQTQIMRGSQLIDIRVGDRVMNTRNNYRAIVYDPTHDVKWHTTPIYDEKLNYTCIPSESVGCFNGFVGDVIKIVEGYNIVVKFDLIDEPVLFTIEQKNDLDLAYSITVHKSQGSEWENVVILLDFNHQMCTKELLYTAITRASKKCVLCGEARAINRSIKNSETTTKHTFLKDMLVKHYGG